MNCTQMSVERWSESVTITALNEQWKGNQMGGSCRLNSVSSAISSFFHHQGEKAERQSACYDEN